MAYFISLYNRFVTLKTRIKASIQEIGNQLKRQLTLIPAITKRAEEFFKQQKEIFKMLTEARKTVSEAIKSNDGKKMDEAQEKIQTALGSVKVVLENNPQIQGVDIVSRQIEELRDTVDKVSYARRTLIDLSADYNRLRAVFPSNLVASIFGFKEEKGYETPLSGEHTQITEEQIKKAENIE